MFPFDSHRLSEDEDAVAANLDANERSSIPSRCLAVYGLPPDITQKMLIQQFSLHGTVEEATVVRDLSTGLSKGCGFVCFQTIWQATLAMMRNNGRMYNGQKISVVYFGGVPDNRKEPPAEIGA